MSRKHLPRWRFGESNCHIAALRYSKHMKTAALDPVETEEFSKVLDDVLKEAAELHRENRRLDNRIAKLRASTRKTIERIRQELDYVKAAR